MWQTKFHLYVPISVFIHGDIDVLATSLLWLLIFEWNKSVAENYENKLVHTIDNTHNIHDSINSRLIKVSAWCRKWPLDGTGFEIHKTSKLHPFSFAAQIFFTFSVSIIHIRCVAGAKESFHKIFNTSLISILHILFGMSD